MCLFLSRSFDSSFQCFLVAAPPPRGLRSELLPRGSGNLNAGQARRRVSKEVTESETSNTQAHGRQQEAASCSPNNPFHLKRSFSCWRLLPPFPPAVPALPAARCPAQCADCGSEGDRNGQDSLQGREVSAMNTDVHRDGKTLNS